ncbi:MAG: YdcF family protein [Lachnospiraceae bacterium]|nr:YdcF family protein [Lachnospiraceae bacterium]
MLKILKIAWRILLVFCVACGICLLLLLGINIYVKASVKDRIIAVEETDNLSNVDCIIILGAGVYGDETPSLMLEDRLLRGIELYNKGCAPKLLMSGDHGGLYYDEVNVMKKYAVGKGVVSSDVFMDHAGFSTYESMYRAKNIFGVDKAIIVTQRYHLSRALYVARAMGIDAYGVAAEDINYAGQYSRDVREFFARGKDFLTAIFKPEPSVMGQVIDITGDGDVTNDKAY